MFLAAGLGTLQELGFFCVLKAHGDPLVKDKLGVIVNSLTPHGKRLFDDVLELFGYLPDDDVRVATPARRKRGRSRLEEMGVHVIDSNQCAGNVEAEVRELLER